MFPAAFTKGIRWSRLKEAPADFLNGRIRSALLSFSIPVQKKPLLQDELNELSKELEKAVFDVEPLFMGMGADLQTVHQNTAGLASNVLNWVGLLDADHEDGAIFNLHRITDSALEELHSCQEEIHEKASQRKMVMEHLHSLSEIFERVEKIGLLLKIVAMNIGIESARTHKSSELFSVVSMETGNLSLKIRKISETSFEVLNAAGESQNALYQSLATGEDQIRQLSRNAGKIVLEAVLDIEALMAASRRAAEEAGKNSRGIREQVGDLVVAIQAHDSISQRVAHITKALKDAKKILEEPRTDNQTAFSVLSLQSLQLKGIIMEIHRIHRQGKEAFEKILMEIDALLDCLTRTGSGSGFSGSWKEKPFDPFQKLKASFENLGQVLNQGQKLLNPVRQSASRASETVDQIEKLVQNVHSIEFETHIMALNAIIKAAHLGQEGGALEVLAQEVKQSSNQSVSVLGRTSDLLSRITLVAEKLQEECAADEVGMTLDQAVANLSKACNDFSRDSNTARLEAEAIKKFISGLMIRLDFMPELANHFSCCLKRMEGMVPEAAPSREEKMEHEKGGMDELFTRYSMERERQIHQSALNSTSLAAMASGLEEEMTTEGKGFEKPVENPDDLGDNVELF
jgi:methyl-accepting chemotaxis protein